MILILVVRRVWCVGVKIRHVQRRVIDQSAAVIRCGIVLLDDDRRRVRIDRRYIVVFRLIITLISLVPVIASISKLTSGTAFREKRLLVILLKAELLLGTAI